MWEEIIGSKGVWGDLLVHSSWREEAQWTAEVFGKCKGNMMVLNLALGRLQGPHQCTVGIITVSHTQAHLELIIAMGLTGV